MVDIGEREIGVFRHEGQVYAYDNRCLHQGGPVCSGELVGVTRRQLGAAGQAIGDVLDEHAMRLVCPWHGWEYDLDSGQSFMGAAAAGVRSYGVELSPGGSLAADVRAAAAPATRVPGPYVAETFEVDVEDEYVVLHA